MRTFTRIFLLFAACSSVIASTACTQSPAARMELEMRRLLGDDANTISVRIEGATAILTGSVRNRSTRVISSEIARTLPGIENVENQISSPELQALDGLYRDSVDAELAARVEVDLLSRFGPQRLEGLNIRVVEGIVSIRGSVESDEFHLDVVDAVRDVEDVRKVVDLITVKPSSRRGSPGEKSPTGQSPRSR